MTLRPVNDGDGTLIENLYNLYRNDLSDYCPDFRYLDSEGYFDKGIADEVLPFGGGVETYIIEDFGCPAGLVMVTDSTYALEGCDYCIQEMYLIRPARHKGLGTEVIKRLLSEKPGKWCLSVYRRNVPAKIFWEKTIRENAVLVYSVPGQDDMIDMVFCTK